MNPEVLKRLGTFVLAFFVTLILAIFLVSAFGQTTPPPLTSKLTITVTGAGPANLFRSDSTCDGATSFTQITTLTTTGYTDTQPANGKAHCYYAILPGNVPTNELEWITPTPATVTSKDASQDLTGSVQ